MEIRHTAGVARVLVSLLVAATSMQLSAGTPSTSIAKAAIGRISVEGGPASPIYAFSFGAAQITGGATGGGGGAGKAVLDDVSIVKDVDALSTSLLDYVVTGRHLQRVRIETYGSNANQVASTFELEDVIVTRFETSGASSESVAFNYRLVRLTAGGATVCWDTSANMRC
jgi:type VI secretion system secreted protein Hcp